MPAIKVVTDGDHERVKRETGFDRSPLLHTTSDWTIDALVGGMHSGATSLMVLIPVEVEGVRTIVAAETSLNCFMLAATVLAAKFEAEVTKPGWAVLTPAARALLKPRIAEAVRRAVSTATSEQAGEAAEMILDGFGADAP